MTVRAWLFGMLVFGSGASIGCGRAAQTASARSTFAQLGQAAQQRDARTLFRLLPERSRRDESEASFSGRLEADADDLRELGERVQRSLNRQVSPAAMVPLAVGDAVWLQESSLGFGLSHPGFGATASPTPVDALRSLRSALTRSVSGAMSEVLSSGARGASEAEVRSLIDALRDPSSLEIASTTRGAEARLPDGRVIALVRENDQWRVDEIREGAR